mgnify:CR=1 FL=1
METPDIGLAPFEPGWVWLVGAGPGDPGLLSLYALHALAHADVVVYDALVDPRILDLARSGAEMIDSGKRGGRPSPHQRDISERLIRLAEKNLRVLRLKGGDPFVFGRGGEEALALVEAGIPFRLVPGITAGIGGLAYAGIPATHRTINTAITFITGHTACGDIPEDDIDWTALAKASPVIVFYMSLKTMSRIAERLIAAGRASDESVAIISKATTPDQSVLVTTLAACAHDEEPSNQPSPALFVVGPVVKLRDGLDWLGAISGKILNPAPLGGDQGGKEPE